jgi:CubicO group peptidase (beta-lactamase class C family)
VPAVATLEQELDAVASETHFSGVIRVDRGENIELARAYGLANRAYRISNELDTQFGIASGAKGLTALAVVRLIEDGLLELSTPVRAILGEDLPRIDDRVTVEHLLSHRSGIGDYLDEDVNDEPGEYVLPVPVHALAASHDYLRVLGGHPQKFAPGERFAYCNGGYVVLALVAERVGGVAFHDLVVSRVCESAGMRDTAFLRSDELPGRAALGYLAVDGLRSNVLHLPVRGSGDGGIYSTAADVSALWRAFFAGEIVGPAWVREMVRSRSEMRRRSGTRHRYGLGFWLHESSDTAFLEGYDSGVSFRSMHDPRRRVTHTVIANTSEGAWPLARFLMERLES